MNDLNLYLCCINNTDACNRYRLDCILSIFEVSSSLSHVLGDEFLASRTRGEQTGSSLCLQSWMPHLPHPRSSLMNVS